MLAVLTTDCMGDCTGRKQTECGQTGTKQVLGAGKENKQLKFECQTGWKQDPVWDCTFFFKMYPTVDFG